MDLVKAAKTYINAPTRSQQWKEAAKIMAEYDSESKPGPSKKKQAKTVKKAAKTGKKI